MDLLQQCREIILSHVVKKSGRSDKIERGVGAALKKCEYIGADNTDIRKASLLKAAASLIKHGVAMIDRGDKPVALREAERHVSGAASEIEHRIAATQHLPDAPEGTVVRERSRPYNNMVVLVRNRLVIPPIFLEVSRHPAAFSASGPPSQPPAITSYRAVQSLLSLLLCALTFHLSSPRFSPS